MSPHSVSLSAGGDAPLDASFLAAVRAFCARTGAPWWSDHVSASRLRDTELNDLLPVPFDDASVERIALRAREARDVVGAPLALENATWYVQLPGATMDEGEFLTRVLDASGCALLLDVNNVYVNAQNHGGDPRAFLDALPFERVCQIHVAGHTLRDGVVIDTHIGPVPDAVWALYRHAIRRAGRVVPTLVEWDTEIPDLDAVLDEVDRARAHCAAALAAGVAG